MLKSVLSNMLRLILGLATLIHCTSIETIEKQIKLDACFSILKHRTTNDFLYFDRLVYLFNNLDGGDDDKTQKVLFLTLCSCYNSISFYLAEEITKQNKLNITQSKISSLSTFEMWEELMISKDQERIQKEVIKINLVFEEIKALNLDISRLQSEFKNQNRIIRNMFEDKLGSENQYNISPVLICVTVIMFIGLTYSILERRWNRGNDNNSNKIK